jgi:hypothetical protein
LTTALVVASGIKIFHSPLDTIIFAFFISSLIDLDHFQFLKKFGFRKYIWAEKRLVAPLHNFFFLAALAIASAFSAIFISPILSILIFSMVLHVLWDITEDVFVFRTSFRRWEKTWGLNEKDLEDSYNELLAWESQQPEKPPSRVRKIGRKLKEKIRKHSP